MSWLQFWLWNFVPLCSIQPSISGLQCLFNICGDYAAEHEIIFNCNQTVGVLFVPKGFNNLLHRMFFWIVYVYNFLTKSHILVHCHMPHWRMMMIYKFDTVQVQSLYCAGIKLRCIFVQCSLAVKTLYSVPVPCQYMLADCGANTHRKFETVTSFL